MTDVQNDIILNHNEEIKNVKVWGKGRNSPRKLQLWDKKVNYQNLSQFGHKLNICDTKSKLWDKSCLWQKV